MKKLSVFVFIIAFSLLAMFITACDNSKYQGKYYRIENGELTYEWIELKAGGLWSDNDGETGTYTIKGTKITITDINVNGAKGTVNATLKNNTISFSTVSGDFSITYEFKKDSSRNADAEILLTWRFLKSSLAEGWFAQLWGYPKGDIEIPTVLKVRDK